MTASLRDIRVFTTFPHECSYLDGKEATTLFIDPRQTISKELYSHLSAIGFRRSGDHIYRPHCARCNACIASRIPVASFKRTMKLVKGIQICFGNMNKYSLHIYCRIYPV